MSKSTLQAIMLHKQIQYTDMRPMQTSMQVLHKLLPELQITGFQNLRTSIFEERCQAIIHYKNSQPRRHVLHMFKPSDLNMELSIRVSKSMTSHTFDIFSEFTQIG